MSVQTVFTRFFNLAIGTKLTLVMLVSTSLPFAMDKKTQYDLKKIRLLEKNGHSKEALKKAYSYLGTTSPPLEILQWIAQHFFNQKNFYHALRTNHSIVKKYHNREFL